MLSDSGQMCRAQASGYPLSEPGLVVDAPGPAVFVEASRTPEENVQGYPLLPPPEPKNVWDLPAGCSPGPTDADRNARRRSMAELDDERQLSLRSLMALLTASGLVMALGARVNPPILAALLGVAALLAHWLLAALSTRKLAWHLAAWLILGAYLLTAIIAVAKS